jgi:protocatechuate 3,4-dioxygenase beta subunit
MDLVHRLVRPSRSSVSHVDRRGFLGVAAGGLVTLGAACSGVDPARDPMGGGGGKYDNLEFDENGVCLSGPTGDDALGPYWSSSLNRTNVLARPDEPGQRMVVMGRVLAKDCITPIPGALIVAWQANDEGLYDYNLAGLDQGSSQGQLTTAETNLRGLFQASGAGTYSFETIFPSEYPLNLLDPASSAYRAPHVHLAVFWNDAFGVRHQLVTQMYFAPSELVLAKVPDLDQLNANDLGASTAETSRFLDVSGGASGMWMGQFDLVLEVDPSA